MTIVSVRFQLRRDTAANWTTNAPVLLTGEIAIETDTGRMKVGDGATSWPSLAYTTFGLTGQALTWSGLQTFSAGIRIGASGPKVLNGTGTPEGVVTAGIGSLFLRSDGGAGTSLYGKESGVGNTGWIGK